MTDEAIATYEGVVEDESHSWNQIQLNGEFYHFDATWESDTIKNNPGLKPLEYFGMSDERRNRAVEFFSIPIELEVFSNDM